MLSNRKIIEGIPPFPLGGGGGAIEGEEIRVERRSKIMPEDVNKEVYIHDGKEWKKRLISESMVGDKMGSFVGTKKRAVYKQKKKKLKGKKK